jgi:hypothetical protein
VRVIVNAATWRATVDVCLFVIWDFAGVQSIWRWPRADLIRLLLGLLDGDPGATLPGVGQALDAAVDDGTNPLQELDPGIGKVFPHVRGYTEGFPELVHNFAA